MTSADFRWVFVKKLPRFASLFVDKIWNFITRQWFGTNWITRRLMHGQDDALVRFASEILEGWPAGDRASSSELLQILTSWHAGTISHESAVEEGRRIADKVAVSRTSRMQLEVWERLCQNFGLHQVAGAFARKLRERISLEAWSLRTPSAFEREFVASLHWGDMVSAQRSLTELQGTRLNASQVTRVRRYATYFEMWQSSSPHPDNSDDISSFSEAVRSSKILIYGPGETSPESLRNRDFDLVVRTCGLGKYVFDSPDDLVGNKTDIAYVNPEVFDVGSPALQAEAVRALSRYRFAVTKRTAVAMLPNNRVSTNLGPLFLRGHPHKGTQIILDLLFHRPRELYVIGMNFFLAKNAYRQDSLGVNALTVENDPQRRTHDRSGSEGGLFDLNWQYASHNLRENFGLVRNLYGAGLVTGDAAFSRVMELTVEEYLAELDSVVGRLRI